MLIGALVTPFGPAQATSTLLCTGYSSCSSKGYSSYGYSTHKSTSYWRMYTGTNCTNYVAYRLVATNGMLNARPHSGDGNAEDWGTTESRITDKTPAGGAVAWWGKTGHHVAYVEKVVSSKEIIVSESNWSGEFDWRRITSSSGWPDGFIHFADLKLKNTAKPYIIGNVQVGASLSASPGSWSPGGTYRYQWYADSVAIPGATQRTLAPTAAQVNSKLAIKVTASRPNYPSTNANSASSIVAPGTFVRTIKPAINGTPRVDDTLTVTTGSWSPTGTYAYQWFADGVAIPGDAKPSFTPGPDQVGTEVTARVTVSKASYSDSHSTSVGTAAVAPGHLTATTKPSISGRPTVGTRLSAHPGSWSTTGLSYAYQWYADGTAVSGATGSTYVPVAANHMQHLTVRVTASRRGYTTNHAESVAGLAVIRGTLSNTAKPVITGHVRVGSRLTATAGTWSANSNYSYQWYAGHDRISGATGSTFIPTRSQLGHTIFVHVAASRDSYSSGSVNSSRTVGVALGSISFSKSPAISGTSRVGSRLTVDPGAFTPAGATVRYQWLRDGKAISYTTSTHTLNAHDHGAKLSVRLAYSAAGYTTRTVTTAAVGPIKSSLS
jgi:surface antigen